MKEPTLRNIFELLECSNTPELIRLERSLFEMTEKLCGDPKTADETVCAVSELMAQSQYIGFMQGFDLARSLLSGRPV